MFTYANLHVGASILYVHVYQHVRVKSVVVHLNVLVKHVVVVHPNAPVFRYVPAKNAVVFLLALVCLVVHVSHYVRVSPYVLVNLDVLVNLNHVVHHYVHVVVNLAWAYVIVTANLEDYVVVLVFRCVLVYLDVLAYQFVLAAVAHLVHARVSVTHHRVLAIVAQYVVH